MLARKGLNEAEYSIERVGGTAQRWNALRDKKQSGTLLSTPFNLIAQQEDFIELAKATKVIVPYQGNVAATRRSWARQNESLVIIFVRGYVQAIDWLHSKTNREEAVRILENNVPEMSPGLAQKSYEELLDAQDGFSHKGRMNFEGPQAVLALRSHYAEPPKKLAASRLSNMLSAPQ
jgi:ABC-type nitrate/sulfonate/bicarbonate transport system substrate-binding protein